MNNQEFLNTFKKNLGFKHAIFICNESDMCHVQFTNDNQYRYRSNLDVTSTLRTYPHAFEFYVSRDKDICFASLVDSFVDMLNHYIHYAMKSELNCYDFELYIDNKLICKNPRSLEEILIQSELNA